MYILERNGQVFEMRHEVIPDAFCPPSHDVYKGVGAEYKEAWELFMKTGELPKSLLPAPIANSWERCRQQGVDPGALKCVSFSAPSKIAKQLEWYAEIGSGVERLVFEQIHNKDLLMTVADAEGRILRTCGDRDVLQKADNLQFGPGAQWSEDSVGTNAVSLSLSEHAPSQVMGEAHFCTGHHSWGCSAAPIFTPFGQLWGCFDISGPLTADHSQALRIALNASREIERLLLRESITEIEHKSNTLLAAVLGSVPVGVLMADGRGMITYANTYAEKFLRVGGNIRGQNLRFFFDCGPFASFHEKFACTLETFVLPCLTNRKLVARVTPLNTGRASRNFAVITLQEEAPALRLWPSPGLHAVESDPFADILYKSSTMQDVVERARRMALRNGAVLIHGETGTGKELFARAIHKASQRSDGPFIAVNCGTLPRELVQSELFGYEKGAFTGADNKAHPGKFEQADQGTLFLDEITEMPKEMQVNLLRPLEEHTVTRIGGRQEIPVNFRLITATNRDMNELVLSGRFREDLFYRVNVLVLEVPPLRDRLEDIPLIAETQGRRLCEAGGQTFAGLSSDALTALQNYNWPGNVRQLIHCMEYAVSMAVDELILPKHLPAYVTRGNNPEEKKQGAVKSLVSEESFNLNKLESEAILAAFKHYEGNIQQTARSLGIGRNTLYAKLRKLEVI